MTLLTYATTAVKLFLKYLFVQEYAGHWNRILVIYYVINSIIAYCAPLLVSCFNYFHKLQYEICSENLAKWFF